MTADGVRGEILDAAAALFGASGFRATTMHDVAAAAGLTKPTLYRHFAGKESLLVALYEQVMDDAVATATAIAGLEREPLEVLRDLLVYRVRATCERQALYTVFFEEEDQLPAGLIDRVVERRRAYEDVHRRQVDRLLAGRDDLGLDPTLVLNACLGAANWVYKWYEPDGPLDPEQLGRTIAGYVLAPLDPPS